MAEFTPGQWRVRRSGIRKKRYSIIRVTEYVSTGEPYSWETVATDISDEATAKLFVASPDLYAACRAASEYFSSESLSGGEYAPANFSDVYAQVDAALAKTASTAGGAGEDVT